MAISLRCSRNGRGHITLFVRVPAGEVLSYAVNGEEVPSVEAQKLAEETGELMMHIRGVKEPASTAGAIRRRIVVAAKGPIV